MGEPVSTALLLKGAGAAFSGLAGYGEAQGVKNQAEINSFIGKTRAIQTDTANREGLNDELATLRATLAANGQPQNVGTGEITSELRKIRGRERRVEVANRNQESADFRMQAANAGAAGTGALLGGLIKAGPDLYDLYQRRRA
jgi:ribosomal protein L29